MTDEAKAEIIEDAILEEAVHLEQTGGEAGRERAALLRGVAELLKRESFARIYDSIEVQRA